MIYKIYNITKNREEEFESERPLRPGDVYERKGKNDYDDSEQQENILILKELKK